MRLSTAGVAVMLLGVFLFHAAKFDPKVTLGDFVGYWSSGHAFIADANPYDEATLSAYERALGWDDEATMFVWYPPWGLLITAWFGLLPFWPARLLFLVLTLALLVLAGGWLWRRAGGQAAGVWQGELVALLFIPSLFCAWVGQMSVLLLAGILAAVWLLEHEHDWLAGLALCVVSLKPQVAHLFFALLFLWCISYRRWRILTGWLGGLLLALLLVFWMNPAVSWEAMLSRGGPLLMSHPTLGFTLRLLTGEYALQFVPTLVGLTILLFGWLSWWRHFNWRRHLPLLLALSLATMCFGWTSDMTLLLPAVIYLLVRAEELLAAGQARAGWALLLGLAVLQVLNAVPGQVGVNVFVASAWLPFAVLFLLGWLRLVERRQQVSGPAR